MTDDKPTDDIPTLHNVSRRRVLGGLGAIGVASAGAGLGTSAFFSDEETFQGNGIAAGSLDLKVDWEEHYSDWSDDENVTFTVDDGGTTTQMAGVRMSAPPQNEAADWNGMPDPDNPLIYVHDDALDAFMAATALEAYPDNNDDGSQDDLEQYNECADLADTPEDMDPEGGKALRSNNADTVDEDGNPKPLVSLSDVKPGDFGELTLSYHLCDNPGYVWLTGGLSSASENGVVEPEAKDPDEEDGTVELLDSIQTLLWYDEDGDNVYEPGGEGGGEVDVMLVLDRSGSMAGSKLTEEKDAATNLVNALNLGSNAAQVGVVSFDNTIAVEQALTTDGSAAISAINGLTAGGSTNIEGAVDTASNQLQTTGRSGADKVMVLLSDGAPNVDDDSDGSVDPTDEATAAKGAGIEIFTVGFGITAGGSTAQLLEDMASDPKNTHAFLGDTGEIANIFGQISQQLAGEECFFRGSLRELLNLLSGNKEDGVAPSYAAPGIPLDGDRSTQYREVLGTPRRPNQGSDPNRDPFVDSTTNAIGLAWYLPIDHGNEIQTDSVSFDLGFYTEQARHNDGSGTSPLTPTSTDSGWAKLEEDFNGDGSVATSAHARRDDPMGNQALELRNTGDVVVAGPVSHTWQTDGTVESFSYSHDGADGSSFDVGGSTVSDDGGINPPSDPSRIAIQTKADDATVTVENVALQVGGSTVHFSGPNNVEAMNDGSDRALEYLVIETGSLDLSQGFTLTGDVAIDEQGDTPSSPEAWAFDVVVE